jgi:hypothetical protein
MREQRLRTFDLLAASRLRAKVNLQPSKDEGSAVTENHDCEPLEHAARELRD